MVQATSVLRAARNAFLALIVVLMGLSVYQFVFVGNPSPLSAVLWTLGVVVYYFSKVYYDRQTNAEDTDTGAAVDSGPESKNDSTNKSSEGSEDDDRENESGTEPLD